MILLLKREVSAAVKERELTAMLLASPTGSPELQLYYKALSIDRLALPGVTED